jgi:hypothetical protein
MKKYRINRRSRSFRPIVTLIALAAIVGGIFLYNYYDHQSPVPSNILHQINFVIFYPKSNSQIVIEKNTFKYSKSLQVVSFMVNYDDKSITIGEQATPDSFSDDPNFYPQFIQKLNGYDTLASVNGSVDLVIPSNTNHETGVMNAKGTLMFAQSTMGNLGENAWRQLFNSLVYVQPN